MALLGHRMLLAGAGEKRSRTVHALALRILFFLSLVFRRFSRVCRRSLCAVPVCMRSRSAFCGMDSGRAKSITESASSERSPLKTRAQEERRNIPKGTELIFCGRTMAARRSCAVFGLACRTRDDVLARDNGSSSASPRPDVTQLHRLDWPAPAPITARACPFSVCTLALVS